MLRSVSAFREGSQPLKQLIADLRTSTAQLRAVDQQWKDEFEELVSALEYIHDTCAERQSPPTREEFDQIVAAVDALAALVSRERTWTEQQIEVVRQIVWDRRPELLDAVDAAFESGFSAKTAYELRNALREEIDEKGTSDGSLNEWGQICEDLISRIVPTSAQNT
ncbi:MAG: hypothetical protein M3Z41_02685 [Candidatus Eremiobacteraeota bacterium]|nr:hypothetical protein [Candidatus Eremiobacteraeota bacterium]